METRYTKNQNKQNETLNRAETKAVYAATKAKVKMTSEDAEAMRKRLFGL